MTVKKIATVTPPFAFEAYSHLVSPIAPADGGGFLFTMPDIPGGVGDGATELAAIKDGREAFLGPAIITAPPAAGSMPYLSFKMVFSSCA